METGLILEAELKTLCCGYEGGGKGGGLASGLGDCGATPRKDTRVAALRGGGAALSTACFQRRPTS